MKKDMAAIFLAAGMSKRFGGRIKQLIPIGPKEESLIEISVKQAIAADFSKIIFVVGEKTREPFEKIFGKSWCGVQIFYALQKYDRTKRDRPWGTLDALCAAKNLVNCPFVVCNGDDIYGEKTFKILSSHLKKHRTAAAIGYRLKDVLSPRGGVNRAIFYTNPDNTVRRIVETYNISEKNLKSKGLSGDELCSMQAFGFQKETMFQLCELLEQFKKEHEGDREIECLIPDMASVLLEERNLTVQIYPATEKWFGVTYAEDEKVLREVFGRGK